jgi:hypothetical protein
MKLLAALILVTVAGCAWQTNALKVGENTYRVSANASPIRGGLTAATGLAIRAANKKCDSMGKTINVTDTQTDHAWPANGVATVTFTCT